MTAGLGIDRLIDIFLWLLSFCQFWTVSNPFERKLVLTLGKVRRKKDSRFFPRILTPGLWLIMPFNLEMMMSDNVVPCELEDLEIDMTLKCKTPLHVEFSALWRIIDMEKFQLEIEGQEAVLVNVQGMVQEYLYQYTWKELMNMREDGLGDRRNALPAKLKVYCNQETRQWGAELVNVYIQSFIRPELTQGVFKAL